MADAETEVEFRPMKPEDIDGILAVDRKIRGVQRALTYQDSFNEVFGGELNFSFVAEADSQIIGFVLARVASVPEEITQVCLIQIIGVYPDYRHQGIATKLIQAVVDGSGSKGIKMVHVLVDHQDSQLQGLFEHTGFHQGHLIDYFKAV